LQLVGDAKLSNDQLVDLQAPHSGASDLYALARNNREAVTELVRIGRVRS